MPDQKPEPVRGEALPRHIDSQWVFVTGNPGDGFTFIGPFATYDEARTYADYKFAADWWITTLINPKGD